MTQSTKITRRAYREFLNRKCLHKDNELTALRIKIMRLAEEKDQLLAIHDESPIVKRMDDLNEKHNKLIQSYDVRVNELVEKQKVLVEALESIVNGAVHPDKAIRRVLVDLDPIRKALEAVR